ncbi:hypothetical protein ACWCYY_19295 [Kitasatospora sp. NPDC001664]
MLDSTIQPTGDETVSVGEKAKILYKQHKPKVVAAATGLGVIALATLLRALQQQADVVVADPHQQPHQGDTWSTSGQGPVYDPERDPFLRKLPKGQTASPEARQRYREWSGGRELPEGYTFVRPPGAAEA